MEMNCLVHLHHRISTEGRRHDKEYSSVSYVVKVKKAKLTSVLERGKGSASRSAR
jgi:hypothetical protein